MNKTVQNLKMEVELMGKTEGILELIWEFIQELQRQASPTEYRHGRKNMKI